MLRRFFPEVLLMQPIRWAMGVALVGCLAGPVAPASAQNAAPNYDVFTIADELKEGSEQNKRLKMIKDRVLTGTLPFAENRQALAQYYGGYYFRSFTQPDQLDKLPLKRQELLSDLKRAAMKDNLKPVHDYLLQQTATYMQGFAQSKNRNFHPAVRYNAMLLLAELNAREAGVSQRVPDPLAAAWDVMVAEYKRADQMDAVRVAAMLGLLRHAKLDWARPQGQRVPADKRNEVAQEMLSLLEQKNPPAGRTRSGHTWMQRRAIDILGALGMVGSVDNVTSTINAVVADSARPMSLRCTAAEALGLVSPNPKLDAKKTSADLASLAVAVTRAELQWIDKFQEEKLAAKQAPAAGAAAYGSMGMGAGMEMGMEQGYEGEMEEMYEGSDSAAYGDMMGMGYEAEMMYGGGPAMMSTKKPADPDVRLAQRRLLSKLVCVQTGLQGLSKTAPDQEKANVAKVEQTLKKLIDAALLPPEDEPNLEGLEKNVRRAVRDVEQLARSAAPSTPAAGDVPSDAPGSIPADVPGAAPTS